MIAAGWSNQEIADTLFISRKTASVHASNIFDKLGAANRNEAAAIAHRLGLSGDAPPPPRTGGLTQRSPRFSSCRRASEIPKWWAISW